MGKAKFEDMIIQRKGLKNNTIEWEIKCGGFCL